MNEVQISKKINEYLQIATKTFAEWLDENLPRICENWWSECVLNTLNTSQCQRIESNHITSLDHLDLEILLRVADKNWYDLSSFLYPTKAQRECIRNMGSVCNNWVHCTNSVPGKDIIISDLHVLKTFYLQIKVNSESIKDIEAFTEEIRKTWGIEEIPIRDASTPFTVVPSSTVTSIIKEGTIVELISDRRKTGVVLSILENHGVRQYKVFIDGNEKQFFEGQIAPVEVSNEQHISDIATLRNGLTAYQILNPTAKSLFSLNAARIDFVPYQFRPALKIIKSDTPRILIADSVGVGKTIEAGLILKELQARNEVESVLVICPKPLVAERKWQLEMKRFDEEFTQLDGAELRRCILDVNRDGEWPDRNKKTIIPYSLLSSEELLYGEKADGNRSKRRNMIGLLDLDVPPHFDLIIVDEAHHIRNSSTQAYNTVKFLCENADAVVFLTATPIQTSDNDLFTLLNVLRPDVILDVETFRMMSRPNQYISQAVRTIRMGEDNWQERTLQLLEEVPLTQWGQSVISPNPVFEKVKTMLHQPNLSREHKVELISMVEGLNSFSNMINRTLRSDIQDFCIRRSHTIECKFTSDQQLLHDELLRFEALTLTTLHGNVNVKFMMSMIQRQAASCIFGLAPLIRSIIDRRLNQIWEDPEVDIEDLTLDEGSMASTIKELSHSILQMADDLPVDDPKFEGAMHAIQNKQKDENNKIIIFSTFKHTLAYLYNKFINTNLRVAQIDGSVKDDDRIDLRSRFELDKTDPNALDILLFTEVGCEGLDYQFCDMMINYDLPWNPMRIEQRIGRIDRRGQKSEAVNIFNMITTGTVDADIYHRCLDRIGVFENSIGECSEILGQISKEIESIAISSGLSDDERCKKLSLITDNEIRKIQELSHLEMENKDIFGIDLANMSMSRDIQEAENPWLSPSSIQRLVEEYLSDLLDNKTCILGDTELKVLRLATNERKKLLKHVQSNKISNSSVKINLVKYLKGNSLDLPITFDGDCAQENRKVMFITTTHPLVKMAAEYFNTQLPLDVCASISCDDYPSGTYPFLMYSWEYTGQKPERKPIAVCMDDAIQKDLFELLQTAVSGQMNLETYESQWYDLDGLHLTMWQDEKTRYIEDVRSTSLYKIESNKNSWKNVKRSLEIQISTITDSHILHMKNVQLANKERKFNDDLNMLRLDIEKADIHIELLVRGVLIVRNSSDGKETL